MDSESPSYSYVPAGRFTGGHTMTLWTWARRRRFPRLPAPEARLFDTAPGVRVLAQCHWQPERRAHPALLTLHGLEGSSDAHYMLVSSGSGQVVKRSNWNSSASVPLNGNSKSTNAPKVNASCARG